MFIKDQEAIRSAVHKEMVSLIKEYARMGYLSNPGTTNEEFERLWDAAFGDNIVD